MTKSMKAQCISAAALAMMMFGSAPSAAEEQSVPEIAGTQSESALCVAARMGISWVRRTGAQFGAAAITEMPFVIVDDFKAGRDVRYSRPKSVKRRDWKKLVPVDNAPAPSSCASLDNFAQQPVFVPTLEEAKQVPNAAIVRFDGARASQDNKGSALRFSVINVQDKRSLNAELAPYQNGDKWVLNPQKVSVSVRQ